MAWWLERIAAAGVPRLWIVHGGRELFALEADLSRSGYDDALARLGFRRVDLRAKYARSDTVQRLGAFPAWYHASSAVRRGRGITFSPSSSIDRITALCGIL